MLAHLISKRVLERSRSVVQLCASPVSAASIVPDFVIGSVSDPVGKGTVLLDLFCVAGLLTE